MLTHRLVAFKANFVRFVNRSGYFNGKIYLLLAAILALASCDDKWQEPEQQHKKPVAEFSYEMNGRTVIFQDLSSEHMSEQNFWDL